MGVWIETLNSLYHNDLSKSLLMWECGLKQSWHCGPPPLYRHSLCGSVDWNYLGRKISGVEGVTPYVGVWIETLNKSLAISPFKVTPYVGVWIETDLRKLYHSSRYQSLLMWECGLKQYPGKITRRWYRHSLCGSVDWNLEISHKGIPLCSHSLCGSVDWNNDILSKGLRIGGHSLCGSVDWNRRRAACTLHCPVTPYVGVWIETVPCVTVPKPFCHSLCGSVDWNIRLFLINVSVTLSLLMWECGLKL